MMKSVLLVSTLFLLARTGRGADFLFSSRKDNTYSWIVYTNKLKEGHIKHDGWLSSSIFKKKDCHQDFLRLNSIEATMGKPSYAIAAYITACRFNLLILSKEDIKIASFLS